jgi:hypothetical protein
MSKDGGDDHPELMPGEVFLTNDNCENFDEIGYQTKRAGNVAYDIHGNVIEGLFPVFVKKSEYDANK